MNKSEDHHSFLTEEFKQAWEHYRHIENARTKYMNFFYSVLIGVSGVSLAVFKDFDIKYLKNELLVIMVLLYCINVFTIYIYSNVKKAGFVLSHYENVMKEIRILVYPESFPHAIFNIRNKQHPLLRLKIFSVQATNLFILVLFMYLVDFLSICLLSFFQDQFQYNLYIIITFIILSVTFFTFKTFVIFAGNSKPINQVPL